MPNRDKTGPAGKGPKTGRGMGPCGTEEALEKKRGKGIGPCGDGTPRGGGRGGGRRKGPNGITYYT